MLLYVRPRRSTPSLVSLINIFRDEFYSLAETTSSQCGGGEPRLLFLGIPTLSLYPGKKITWVVAKSSYMSVLQALNPTHGPKPKTECESVQRCPERSASALIRGLSPTSQSRASGLAVGGHHAEELSKEHLKRWN